MTEVSSNSYDNNGVGDGNLTETIAYPNGSTAPRVTDMFYDWRDRQVATKASVLLSGGVPNPSGEADAVHRPISYSVYDNLGEVTTQESFDGDGVSITSTDGVPNAPSSSLLRARRPAATTIRGGSTRAGPTASTPAAAPSARTP